MQRALLNLKFNFHYKLISISVGLFSINILPCDNPQYSFCLWDKWVVYFTEAGT